MDWIADSIAGLALVFSVITFVTSRRDARGAEAAAERALSAAEESAMAAERSAAAAERQVELATPPAIDFRLEFLQGEMYALVNAGTSTATGVTVDREGLMVVGGAEPPQDVTLHRGEGATFMLYAGGRHVPPSSIPVRCNESPEVHHVAVPMRF